MKITNVFKTFLCILEKNWKQPKWPTVGLIVPSIIIM